MIASIPLLRQSLYRSGVSGSHYNPRNLVTRVLSGDLDKEKYSLQMAFECNATFVHERVHWLQHHGTSMGVFLEAIRFSQQMTTLRHFRDMEPERVSRLLESRMKSSKSILNLDPQSQRPILETGDRSDLNDFRWLWFDHQIVHAIFEDSSTFDSIGMPHFGSIGEVAADVMIALCFDARFECSTSNILCSDPITPRGWFSPRREDFVFVHMSGIRLTTKMIFEAAATVAEIQLFAIEIWQEALGQANGNDALDRRIRSVLESEYGCLLYTSPSPRD